MTGGPDIWRPSDARAVHLDRPRLLAILNLTPDSFADAGRLPTPAHAADAARRAADDGADALDVGAESTRPGARRVPAEEQTRRLVPAIRAIRAAGVDLPVSVDTTRAAVARAALDAGADAINDVAAGLEDDAMLALAARRRCGLILMHRLAPPDADRFSDAYDAPPAYPRGVVPEVRDFLAERARAALRAGVPADRIVLDPGLGFGKSVEQNLRLIDAAADLAALGHPVLSALSRKSFTGRAGLGRDSDPAERLPATLALSALHLRAGARIFRVHDVAEHRQALDAAWAAIRAAPDETAGVAPGPRPGPPRSYHPSPERTRAAPSRKDAPPMANAQVRAFTDANFDADVLKAQGPVLVDFWAEWCMPCKILAPTIDDIANQYAGKAVVGKVDIDANQQVAMQFGISAIPTVILFKDGQVARKFVGLTKKEDLAAALDALA